MAQEIPTRRLDWLREQVVAWQRDEVIGDDEAAAILGRYRAGRRGSVVQLVSVIGAAFVGVGLISLVASNLDRLSPMTRFVGIVAVWLAAVVLAEVLLRRDPGADDGRGSVGVGAARVIAVAAYGASLFQAAQSLQVPAYSSSLLGCWAAGALAYAYATRGTGPLLVGIATLVGWYGWVVGERSDSTAAVVLSLVTAALAATALAGLHEGSPLSHFSAPWSYVGALLVLVGLFAAAIPTGDDDGLGGRGLVVGAVLAVALAAVAAARGTPQVRRETAAAAGILVAALVLAAWQPVDAGREVLTGAEAARAVVATLIYLCAAVWVAVVGAVRDRPQLTNLATAALVVFVTVQSFGVFAPLLSGAALFLALGVVLIAAGTFADRGRRRIIEEVSE